MFIAPVITQKMFAQCITTNLWWVFFRLYLNECSKIKKLNWANFNTWISHTHTKYWKKRRASRSHKWPISHWAYIWSALSTSFELKLTIWSSLNDKPKNQTCSTEEKIIITLPWKIFNWKWQAISLKIKLIN